MVRFVIGSGSRRVSFVRAPAHTAQWDEQKVGLRLTLGMPAHGNGKA
jgi:hypothetical protein